MKKDEAITLEQLYIEQTNHESFYKIPHEYDDYNSETVTWDKEIHLEKIYCRLHPFSKIVNVGLDVSLDPALLSKKKAKENMHKKLTQINNLENPKKFYSVGKVEDIPSKGKEE